MIQALHPDYSKFKPLIGIPFKIHGRDLTGCDCWGLVCLFYKFIFDIELNSYISDYTDIHDLAGIVQVIEKEQEKWQKVRYFRFGDVLLLRTTGIAHVGIFIDETRMLHTTQGKDSCLERLRSPIWQSRIISGFRYVKR